MERTKGNSLELLLYRVIGTHIARDASRFRQGTGNAPS